jgi:phosphoribosylglycinamide formyltransferase-1
VSRKKLPVVVLISGRGSNLQAIIDDGGQPDCPFELCAVVSNRPDAAGLERALQANIATRTVDHKSHASRESFDAGLARAIDTWRPGLVVLAGFMRLLTHAFVDHYDGRLINIHPSLLPAFPGLDTHQRAIASGAAEHGASVHFVTAALDGGPLIVQARVPVLDGDDADTLAARVLAREHRILPLAIRWFAEGRLSIEGAGQDQRVILDGKPAL